MEDFLKMASEPIQETIHNSCKFNETCAAHINVMEGLGGKIFDLRSAAADFCGQRKLSISSRPKSSK